MTNGACIVALLETQPWSCQIFVLEPWEFML